MYPYDGTVNVTVAPACPGVPEEVTPVLYADPLESANRMGWVLFDESLISNTYVSPAVRVISGYNKYPCDVKAESAVNANLLPPEFTTLTYHVFVLFGDLAFVVVTIDDVRSVLSSFVPSDFLSNAVAPASTYVDSLAIVTSPLKQ